MSEMFGKITAPQADYIARYVGDSASRTLMPMIPRRNDRENTISIAYSQISEITGQDKALISRNVKSLIELGVLGIKRQATGRSATVYRFFPEGLPSVDAESTQDADTSISSVDAESTVEPVGLIMNPVELTPRSTIQRVSRDGGAPEGATSEEAIAQPTMTSYVERFMANG